MLKRLALATLLECAMDPTHPLPPAVGSVATAVGGGQDQQQGEQQASQVPAAAEQAPGPAVGGQIQVWVPQWNPDWSLEEIAHFRTFPTWNALQTWARQNLWVSAQKTLAAHTTTACQPASQSPWSCAVLGSSAGMP